MRLARFTAEALPPESSWEVPERLLSAQCNVERQLPTGVTQPSAELIDKRAVCVAKVPDASCLPGRCALAQVRQREQATRDTNRDGSSSGHGSLVEGAKVRNEQHTQAARFTRFLQPLPCAAIYTCLAHRVFLRQAD